MANAISEFLKSEDYMSRIGVAFKLSGAQHKEKVRAAGVFRTVKVHMRVLEDTTKEKFKAGQGDEDKT